MESNNDMIYKCDIITDNCLWLYTLALGDQQQLLIQVFGCTHVK